MLSSLISLEAFAALVSLCFALFLYYRNRNKVTSAVNSELSAGSSLPSSAASSQHSSETVTTKRASPPVPVTPVTNSSAPSSLRHEYRQRSITEGSLAKPRPRKDKKSSDEDARKKRKSKKSKNSKLNRSSVDGTAGEGVETHTAQDSEQHTIKTTRGSLNRLIAVGRQSSPQRNSTATIYMRSTCSKPHLTELLKCISKRMHNLVCEGRNALSTDIAAMSPKCAIFDEREFPISKDYDKEMIEEMPDETDIFLFIGTVYNQEKLSPESGILMMVFLDRLLGGSNMYLLPYNWRRVAISTLILATKVWEEEEVWNVDFLKVFPEVTVKDLAQLEKVLLNMIRYNVTVSSSLYAKYYFELRALVEKDGSLFPAEPLTKEASVRLEARSKLEEERLREAIPQPKLRPKSMYTGKTKSAKFMLDV